MRSFFVWTMMMLALAAPAVYGQDEKQKKDAEKQGVESGSTDSQATVYIYRYKQFVGSALEPAVYCDESELGNMDNGRYFKVKLDAGKHAFRSNDKQSGLELDLKSGEDYYIRVEIAAGFMKGHGRLMLMQKEQGAYEIKKLKPIDASKVKDKKKVVIEQPAKEKP